MKYRMLLFEGEIMMKKVYLIGSLTLAGKAPFYLSGTRLVVFPLDMGESNFVFDGNHAGDENAC